MAADKYEIKPVTGFLDTRSTPDLVPAGGYRWALNFSVPQKDRLCCMPGWTRHLDKASGYNNEDLHDQLFGNTRQFITMLHQAETEGGISKLFAATQNRLYALNGSTGNYQIIWQGFGGPPETGCAETRLMAARLMNTVLFTNDREEVMSHVIDQPVIDGSSVSRIKDLETLNVKKAAVVVSWNNLMFLMNLVMDGRRQSNIIIWSDYRRPLSYVPKKSISLAGRYRMPSGEIILNAKPLGNVLLIYTNRGIWEASIVGGDQVVSFARRYIAEGVGKRCLAFRNTLVSDGDVHYFWGNDGIYSYDLFTPKPVLVDWIHRASDYIFSRLDTSRCLVHVGGYNARFNEIWWSWAGVGEACPTMTFKINVEFPFSAFVDHGISAFANHEPDSPMSLRAWMLERCICTIQEFSQFGGDTPNEGGRCTPEAQPACGSRPVNFFTSRATMDGDITHEALEGEPDADSLYAMLGEIAPEEICAAEDSADACSANERFVFASVADKCIKETADVFYREHCTGFSACGTYSRMGYKPKIISGAIDITMPSDEKRLHWFEVEAHAVAQSVPPQLRLRIGVAAQAVDPLTAAGNCVIIWHDQPLKDLKCLSELDAAAHKLAGTRPDTKFWWPVFVRGRYIYFELEVINDKVSPKDTGVAGCFSRYELGVESCR